MKRRVLGAVVLAALSWGSIEVLPPHLSVLAVGDVADWQALENLDAGFAVTMPPGTLREGVQPVETSFGTLDMYILGVDLNDRALAVMVAEFPAFFGAIPRSTLFDGAIEGVVANVNERFSQDRQISLAGYPGLEMFYEGRDGLIYRHRLYLVDRRLYQVVAVIPSDTSEVEKVAFFEDAEPFFESFEFLDRLR
ncbi:MAG: hypothetical protein J7641_02555 [Cyanobacteria bacterium SID2]|nr:hypothetical protein [Cyanobacteria bacterium SID2]MBP0003819.1 hypothetical protein [Cyanobacteria bacterium SBC]